MATHAGIGLVAGYAPSRLQALARLTEQEGFQSLWIADERLYRNVYVSLAIAAGATRRVRLGTAVTNPFTRHPALTAAAIATVDELSNGRAVLGLGAGGSAPAALGIARAQPAVALRESVELVRALTAGERVEFRGRMFTFTGALDFTPLRRVPVYVAARGPRSLEVAGEVADGLIIGGLVGERTVRYALEGAARGAGRAGRAPSGVPTVAWIYAACSHDPGAAEDAVRRVVALSVIASRPVISALELPLSVTLRRYLDEQRWILRPDVIDGAAQLVDRTLLEEFAIAGTPEGCGEKLGRLASHGIDELALLIYPTPDQSLEQAVQAFAGILRPHGFL